MATRRRGDGSSVGIAMVNRWDFAVCAMDSAQEQMSPCSQVINHLKAHKLHLKVHLVHEVLLREVRHGSNISLLIRSIKMRLQHASTRCDGEFVDKSFGKFPASFFGQSHVKSQYQ